MKAEYRITEDDYAKAMQFGVWRRLSGPLAIWAIISAIMAIQLLPLVAALMMWLGGLVWTAVLAAARVYIGVPNDARRMYQEYKALREPLTVELSDEGLRLGSVTGEAILLWRMIVQWRQNDQFVLIYQTPKVFNVLPKSVGEQGFDIPLLVQRLAERVGPERW